MWNLRVCGGQNCNVRREEEDRSHAQPSIRMPHGSFSPPLADCYYILSTSVQRALEGPEQIHK